MKREIKFRGKRLDNGEWVIGSQTFQQEDDRIYLADGEFCEIVEVDPATVGQFTGLLDKNGKEIYEGDLISQINFNGEEYEAVCEVLYDCEAFCLKMRKGNEKAMKNSDSLLSFGFHYGGKLRKGEIIGIIHDNPEQFKSGQL